MRILRAIATVISLAIAALGALGVVAPEILLALGRSLLAPPALYAVALLRIAFGALLIAVATETRIPVVLRVLGSFIIVAGVFTPFVDAERFDGIIAWLSGHHSVFRGIAIVPLFLGLLLAYAINTNRRAAARPRL